MLGHSPAGIIDADAGGLSEALDAVRDLAAQTHAPELGRQMDIQHDGALAFRFAAPLWIVLDGVSEGLYDLEHAQGDVVAVDVDAAIPQVALDLVVR